jgi:CRP-like cAMP-binding protein
MNTAAVHGPSTGNLFLDRAVADRAAFRKYLQTRVPLGKGQALSTRAQVYFPVDALVSLSFILANGYVAEVRQIGREGFVGLSAVIGPDMSQATAVVQSAGSAYGISADVMRDMFESSPRFRRTTLQYMQALMQEAAQYVVCTRFHSIAQQCCRSLLLAADRLDSRTIHLTHEQLAVAIGCRREAVSLAARQLQSVGMISYRYGKIRIVDRKAMEARACECYPALRRAFSLFFTPDQVGMTDQTDGPITGV